MCWQRSGRELYGKCSHPKIFSCLNRGIPRSLAIVWKITKRLSVHKRALFTMPPFLWPYFQTDPSVLHSASMCARCTGLFACLVCFFNFFYFQGEAASLFPLHTTSILSRSSCCEETGPGIYGEHKKCVHSLSPYSSRFTAHLTNTLN